MKNLSQLLPFVLLPLLFVVMTRGQKKKAEQHRQLLNSLSDGAEVTTAAGLYGFVHSVEGDVVWLEISDGVVVRVSKQAIGKVISAAPEVETEGIVPPGGEPRSGDDIEKG